MTIAAERCSDCGVSWPVGTKACGICMATDLDHFLHATSVTATEAKALSAKADFQRFYDKREEERLKKGVPTPEQMGAIDAVTEIKRVRGLRKAMHEITELPERQ